MNDTYNTFTQLVTVSMERRMVLENGTTITQTQCAFNSCASTFAYNNDQRVQSVTNPENGTTSYTYNADGTMATKTDAKGQQMVYSSIPKASYIR